MRSEGPRPTQDSEKGPGYPVSASVLSRGFASLGATRSKKGEEIYWSPKFCLSPDFEGSDGRQP